MGVYSYTIKRKNIKAIYNGIPITLYLMQFSHKPTYSFHHDKPRWERVREMIQHRVISAWDNANERPKYVCHIFEDKPSDNDTVYLWKDNGPVVFCDNIDTPGTKIGELKKSGKSWIVAA